jgi:uroporphyrinogen-III synthase
VLTDAWAHGVLDAITITSSEGLRNLHALLDREDAQRLQRTLVFVTHQRIAESARALGIDDVIVAGAGDDGRIEARERRFAHG